MAARVTHDSRQGIVPMIDLLEPPSEEEIDDLRALLASDRVAEDSMTLSEMDGFVTGLVVGPGAPPPAEWVPQIFGGELPDFKDDDEAGVFAAIILRRSVEISVNLDQDPPVVEPWLEYDADGNPDVGDWANGFMCAVAHSPQRWERMARDPKGAPFLLPLVLLAEPAEGEDPLPIDDEAKAVFAEMKEDVEELLASCVIGTSTYWLARNQDRAGATSPRKKRVKHKRPRRRR